MVTSQTSPWNWMGGTSETKLDVRVEVNPDGLSLFHMNDHIRVRDVRTLMPTVLNPHALLTQSGEFPVPMLPVCRR